MCYRSETLSIIFILLEIAICFGSVATVLIIIAFVSYYVYLDECVVQSCVPRGRPALGTHCNATLSGAAALNTYNSKQ